MSDIVRRKADHIEIGLTKDVAMKTPTGFADYRFEHQALPEIDFADVSVATAFLGRAVGAPLLISSMTGGSDEAETINRNLATAAAELNIPMAVGSQRALVERPEALATFRSARDAAPDIQLFGNIGAVQLNKGIGVDDIRRTVDLLGADGIFLHLNPLQEAVQSGGDTEFGGLLDKISRLVEQLDRPVLVKEVGCGIAPAVAVRLVEAGVAAVDVSGAGGTSWASIEAERADDESKRRLGKIFSDWGNPTVECLTGTRELLQDLPLIASGGIRSGLDAAKALVLGADAVAFAMPLLKPATVSPGAVLDVLRQTINELSVAMFLTGSASIEALKANDHLLRAA